MRSNAKRLRTTCVAGLLLFATACGGPAATPTPTEGSAATSTTAVAQAELSVPEIVRTLTPSTVMIRAKASNYVEINSDEEGNPILQELETLGPGSGTGVVLDNGYVLTNAHVVEGTSNITVSAAGNNRVQLPAQLIGSSSCDDLALLKINDASDLTPAILGDSGALVIGEDVIAMGYPFGEQFGVDPTVTKGIVSRLNVSRGDLPPEAMLQTDAAISGGNSGGPLINLRGEVIGINTSSTVIDDSQNLNYAINIDYAKTQLELLRENGTLLNLGLSLRQIAPIADDYPYFIYFERSLDNPGIFVQAVESGPASRIGIKNGDLLTSLRGESVNSSREVCNILRTAGEGKAVAVEVLRRLPNSIQVLTGELVIGSTEGGKELTVDREIQIESAVLPVPTDGQPIIAYQSVSEEQSQNEQQRFEELVASSSVLLEESFDTPERWQPADLGGIVRRHAGNYYELTLNGKQALATDLLRGAQLGNSYLVQLDVLLDGDAQPTSGGIVFDAQGDTDSAIYFLVRSDGQWEITTRRGGNNDPALSLAAPTQALQPNETNQLRVLRTPEYSQFWINGVPVGAMVNIYNGGQVGVAGYAGTREPFQPVRVGVDNMVVLQGR